MHAVAFLVLPLLAGHPACGDRSGCAAVKVADAGTGADGALLEAAVVRAGSTEELWAVARKGGKVVRKHLLATGSFDAEPFDPDAVALEIGPDRLGLANATGGACPTQSRSAYRLDPPGWLSSSFVESGGCDVIRRAESWTASDPQTRGVRLDLAVMRSESCPDRRTARYVGVPILEVEEGAWRDATLGDGALQVRADSAFAIEGNEPDASMRVALVSPAVLLVDPPKDAEVELWIGSLAADATRFRIGADGAVSRVAGAERAPPKVERVRAGLAITLPEDVRADTTGLTVGLRTPRGLLATSEVCNDAPATLGVAGRRLPARVVDGRIEAAAESAAFEPLFVKRGRLAGHRWRSPSSKAPAKPPAAKEVTLLVAGEATLERLDWETRAKVSELPAKASDEDWGTDVVVSLPSSARECIALLENLGWRERLVIKGRARRVPLVNEIARTRVELEPGVSCAKPSL